MTEFFDNSTNRDLDFDEWFSQVANQVYLQTNVTFSDQESVLDDYEDGKTVKQVADDIAQEFSDLGN